MATKKQHPRGRKFVKRIKPLPIIVFGIVLISLLTGAAWLAHGASKIRTELTAARELLPAFEKALSKRDEDAARQTLNQLSEHSRSARTAASDPLWKAASSLPWIGQNFSAVSEVANSTDDVVTGAADPLFRVSKSLNWEDLAPTNGKLDTSALRDSSPAIVAAANTVDLTYSRLSGIDRRHLLPEVSEPLQAAVTALDEFRETLRTAADASTLLPKMLGAEGERNYLVLVQNSAEIRASGGLPGVLAVINASHGNIRMTAQTSGSSMGRFEPPVDVDDDQIQIYSSRLGTFISDVNLTPDFPTTAKAAKAMWERRYGGSIDGVVAIDPTVLVHILEASGPIHLPASNAPMNPGLPDKLSSENVIRTMLSDVYLNLATNELQDEYYANASRQIFESLTSGKVSGPALVKALSLSYEENRLHIWSTHQEDQKILGSTGLGGTTSGPSVGGASFGVYFNDGTGAKMDYYVRRTVQLVGMCTDDDYAQYKVRITLANKAPLDAATTLPDFVTGGGNFGTPAGSVRTNIVVYGPALSHVDTTVQDGKRASFASHLDANRPVGVISTQLAAGQSTHVEMTFVKVVQSEEPNLSVTPTLQKVDDVIQPTQEAKCD